MKNKWVIRLYEFFIKYGTAAGMVLVIILLAVIAGWSLYSGSGAAHASDQLPPEHFTSKTVPFYLVCSTPIEMRDTLLEVHNEIAMIAGWLDTGNQWLLYVSEDNGSMSFVVHKVDGEACIIWSGNSAENNAFVPNPAPQWPSDVLTETPIQEGWNQ